MVNLQLCIRAENQVNKNYIMKENKVTLDDGGYKGANGILDIVKKGLCNRCGGCVGLCPAGTLALDGNCYPIQVDKCIECDLCTDICSGASADHQMIGNFLFGNGYRHKDPLGIVQSVCIGHAMEEKIRWQGASGGVVTQILIHLLESGRIQGALVAGPHPDDTALGLGFIARSREDLLGSSQSRYTTTPMLTALKELVREKGEYAVVALPCQVYTLRKLQMKSKKWKKRISLIIGLYCHYRLPHEATREAGAILAPKGTELAAIKYRQKDERGWPYNTVEMTFSDGSTWRSPYGPAQTVSLLGHCFPRGRCLLCIDALAYFADLVVGDPWIRASSGDWKYSVPGGWSGIIVRSDAGAAFLQNCSDAGRLELQSIPPNEVVEGQRVMIMEKFESAPVRMAILSFFGRSVPNYNIDYPAIRLKVLLTEGKFFLMRIITVWVPVRRFFVKFGFSAPGRKFMGWRRQLNKKRAVARLAAKK